MREGLFIVFDGIDGSGKTTQARLLKEYLDSKGYKVSSLSEPSESDYGKKIRNLLRRKEAARIPIEKWIELFKLDTMNVSKIVDEKLKNKEIVICDRYYYSTLAYQLKEEEWQDYVKSFVKPDILFILDVPVKVALERLNLKYKLTKGKKAFFEKEEILNETRKKFLRLPIFLNDNIKIIDGTLDIVAIQELIKKEVEGLLKK